MENTVDISSVQFAKAAEKKAIPSTVRNIVNILDGLSVNSINSLGMPNVGAALDRAFYKHVASIDFLEGIIVNSIGLGFLASGGERKVDRKFGEDKLGFQVGKHLVVVPTVYEDKRKIQLSDGTSISEFHRLGEMHFATDLPTLEQSGNLVAFTKSLYNEATNSLKELARLCQTNDGRVEDITAFYGESHIAGSLARKLGFDIHQISNPLRKLLLYYGGKSVVKKVAEKNPAWQNWKKNYKPPQAAYISKRRLVELFGEKKPLVTPPPTEPATGKLRFFKTPKSS